MPIPDDGAERLDAMLAADTGTLYLEQVRLGSRSRDLLRTDPRMARIERITLRHNHLGDDGVRAIVANPALTGLEQLALIANDVGPDGVRALVDSAAAQRLTRLEVSENRLGPEALAALAGARLPRLRELILQYVGASGLASLLDLPGLDDLALLDLWGNDVSDEERVYYDWSGPPVYSIEPDPTCIALRARLGARLKL